VGSGPLITYVNGANFVPDSGQDSFMAINAVQAPTGKEIHTVVKTISPDAASTMPLLLSSASLEPGQSMSTDLYWQFLFRSSGDQVIDPNGWAAQELTLAPEGK
jgi:hypothetical protein